MNELGLAGDEWVDRVAYLQWHLGNEIGRRWWEHSKRDFPPSFVAMVDESLAAGRFDDNEQLLDALLGEEDPDR